MAERPMLTFHRTLHDSQRQFVRQSHPGLRCIETGRGDMIGYLAIKNHTNCVDHWQPIKSVWEQELGRIECVYHCIIWRCLSTLGCPKYILYLTVSISTIPLSSNTLLSLSTAPLLLYLSMLPTGYTFADSEVVVMRNWYSDHTSQGNPY